MRVAILTQYYRPETGAPQSRLADLAQRLTEDGHEVTVLTAMPNYPLGEVFPEWKTKLVTHEVLDGVTVLRSWIYASPKKSTSRQMACYLSFALTSLLSTLPRVGHADILLWESPPLFLAPVALILARALGSKLVMNVSDLWPQSAVELGVLRGRRLRSFFERWEAMAYRTADLVTCQTAGIEHSIATRYPDVETAFFPNGVDVHVYRRAAEPDAGRLLERWGIPPGAKVIGYAGNFGRAQAVDQVVDAAARLADLENVRFLLVGAGPCKGEVLDRVRTTRAPNVTIADPVRAPEVPPLLSALTAAVVPLADRPIFAGARPSKMFELMSVGVPFVFCGRGEGAELAERSGCGVAVPPEQPDRLAEALRAIVDMSSHERARQAHQARSFVESQFDRAVIARDVEKRLLSLLDDH